MRTVPKVSTVRIDEPDGTHSHAAWCPWCEDLHYHGMGAGNRAPHCYDRTGSPFQTTGYDLDVTGAADRAEAAIPSAPLAKRQPLRARLNADAARLLSLVGSILIGQTRPGSTMVKNLAHGKRRVVVWGRRWNLGRPEKFHPESEGDNLLTLGAALNGISEGVVAVRLIETATGARLDATAVLDVQRAVDAWVARGAPSNAGRRS
ncbi:hypothetical protein [Microvirga sp. CF3016]|uniref:hypothetical protein n=1 Tax=Microvirga sp. CF3016 TaxID=3110181 RepID=UPI002E781AC3|nr:hypothetical protein [Microvirga sp. CF3016]MEE1612066.1 hypothetical protein [Microvirga sp. CF3016]